MKKKLFVLALIVAASLAVHTASAQVHVAVGINETAYPGYTYYSYPAWHGHLRDQAYYDHYHDRFYREHRSYFVGGRGRFDHDRYEKETHWHH
jgi:hypothetical protein